MMLARRSLQANAHLSLCPVLPKYEVTIDAKDTVNIAQDSFEAKVCAK